MRAADTPPGHAALAELHVADLYSDFEQQGSADSHAASCAASSHRASGHEASSDVACEAPGDNARLRGGAAADNGRLLHSDSGVSGSGLYAAFSDGPPSDTAAPIAGQNGHSRLSTGSGGTSESEPLPNARHASLRGDDIYAAFGGAESGQSDPQPAPTAPPAVQPLQRPPQPRARPLGRSQSSREAPRRQARSFRNTSEQPQLAGPRLSCEQPHLGGPRPSSEQPQLGRPRPSAEQLRAGRSGLRKQQPPQQRAPLANGHANRHSSGPATRRSSGASSKGGKQLPGAGTANAQGTEATYAVYRKYHQAHPLPLPPPPQPLPELPHADATAPLPAHIADATYDGEDAFSVYGHFADAFALQRPPKAEDGSYAGEDAYSVYGRFEEEQQLAAPEAERGLYTDFAEG